MNRFPRIWMWLVLALMVPASSAEAIELNWGALGDGGLAITDSLQIRYLETNFNSSDDDDGVLTVLNKLNLVGTAGGFSLGFRVDSAHYFFEQCVDESACLFQDYVNPEFNSEHLLPEKLHFGWEGSLGTGSLAVKAGDFYTSFGRGMTLNIRKVDELGLDTSLQGGRVHLQNDHLTFEAVAGRTNIQNVAPIDNRYLEDPDDVIVGIETLVGGDGIELGVRGVHVEYADATVLGHEESATIAGGSLNIPDIAGMFAVYVEGALSASHDYDPQADSAPFSNVPGKAFYGALNGFFGAFNLLLEGKHYRQFQISPRDNTLRTVGIVYNAPPTLERYDQLVSSTSDTSGARLRLDYYVRASGTRVYANGLYQAFATGGNDPLGDKGKRAAHVYLGFRQTFGRDVSVELSGGWRDERVSEPLQPGKSLLRHLWHLETDVNVKLGNEQALNVKAEHRTECKPSLSSKDEDCGLLDSEASGHRFHRSLITATYAVQSVLRTSVLYGYTNEQPRAVPTDHFGVQFDWDFMAGSTLRAFGGSLPGGFICAGGTCVDVPPSSSYRLEIVSRF